MGTKLNEKDLQWLEENPGFHLPGRTRLGMPRSTNSDGANTAAANENDGQWYELYRTFGRRLWEWEIYESMIED